ncbi:MAG: YsnF/AvaK domain-containing protein [Ktedonobacteraceae bacterium]
MQQSRRTVIGVFDESAMADQAVQSLEDAGFSNAQIHRHGHQAAGGFMAGLKNLFGGDSARDDVNAREFTDMGVSNEEAQYYENESQGGRHIVSVRADGREQEAMEILRTNGAYNYGTRRGGSGIVNTAERYDNTTTATRTGDTAAYDNTRQTGAREGYADVNADETRRMRLREEQLDVNKQRVQTGEVGLHKEIISEEKIIDVPVTHEEAYIERRPVTDATINDTTPIGESETIRVPLSEERVNVNKNTVVTGEVQIGKRNVEETRRVSENVRHEEARIERDGDMPIRGAENDRIQSDRTNQGNL